MKSNRRDFLRTCGVAVGASTASAALGGLAPGHTFAQSSAPPGVTVSMAKAANPRTWRQHFPALGQVVDGRPLIYFDNAATVHRPNVVIDAVADFYRRDNGNPGRGLHTLADHADQLYESARGALASFINARDPLEIVWVRGASEAINLIATAWGDANLKAGDEVLLTAAEHYSNLVPWQLAARRTGAKLRFLDVTDDGHLRLEDLDRLLTRRTKLVSIGQVSNVLGIVNPVQEICQRAHQVGAKVLIDGAQSIPHMSVDVQGIGCDFFALSGHKMLGPMGVGALWARRDILESMPPYQSGADMAHAVTREGAEYAHGALKFEAGTPNVSGAVGLASAIEFIRSVGYEAIWMHEQALTRRTLEALAGIDRLRILGSLDPTHRIALVSFTVDSMSAPEVVRALDARGIAVRGGELSALPLLRRFGLNSAVRASLYLYNTMDEIDQFAAALTELTRS